MKMNARATDGRFDTAHRLAGGLGAIAAHQDAEGLLRRAVMACLLWEDNFYEDGKLSADNIAELIPQVNPFTVAQIAIATRQEQKLRHTPIFIAREMARHPQHREHLGHVLPQILTRADMLTDFLALYWRDGKQPLAKQVKIGLKDAFERLDAYQLAKYDRKTAVKLRDVMKLVHPNPPNQEMAAIYRLLQNRQPLPAPDTWEVSLSAGSDKRQTWERLIVEKKLGALAFLRNLRNMEKVGVDRDVVRRGLDELNGRWLLPINYIAAAKYAPRYEKDLESLMLRSLGQLPKLAGKTIFVVDVSGSMSQRVSDKSEYTRLDVACAMAMLAVEICEDVVLYATAGSDGSRTHKTAVIPTRHGFGLVDTIKNAARDMGGGGIFTRQCLEYVKEQEPNGADRVIVFSDSQDCDHPYMRVPAPFGTRNYIVDISAHTRGVNYKGVWDAEVAGWSEHFLNYIQQYESAQ